MRNKASSVVAVAAAVIAAVALLPGIGFGESPVHQGGSPTNVYTVKEPGLCPLDRVPIYPNGVRFQAMNFTVPQPSQVVAYWEMKWGWGRTPVDADLYVNFEIKGSTGYEDRGPADGFGWHSTPGHDTGTVTWPFVDVPAGEYSFEVEAIDLRSSANQPFQPELSGGGVTIQGCALTVFVIPTV